MRGSTDPAGRRGALHADYGAEVDDAGVIRHYGRPARTVRAVRNGVGVRDRPADVIVVEGSDRVDYVENVVTGRVPGDAGRIAPVLLLDPQGAIDAELFVYAAEERLLVLAPPGTGDDIVAGWEAFIQDVTFREAGAEFAVFGLHGPTATEKLATVFRGATPPADRWGFVRGEIAQAGVTVARTDAPAGEESYEVICEAADGEAVLDALLALGPGAVPLGQDPWETLTLEAGTPLFEPDLRDRLPNVVGARTRVDFEKGCFVGQEVVSRIENRGRVPQRLVGLRADRRPPAGAAITVDEGSIGTITRAADSPTLESAIAFGVVDADADASVVTLDAEESIPAEAVELPFHEGGEPSGRLPRYG